MSMVRIEQTSWGRIPERRCSSIIAHTWRGDVRPNRVHERIGDRLDRLRLPNVGPAPTEARNRLEAVMEGGRDHSLPDGPLEQPDNPARPLVHFVPTEAGVNHRLANGFELERPELSRRLVAVELAERPDRHSDAGRLRCRLPVS